MGPGRAKFKFLVGICALSFFVLFIRLLVWPSQYVEGQLSTADHLAEPGFWPTQINSPAASFVGPVACTECHSEIYASQTKTPMALTAVRAENSTVLAEHSDLHFKFQQYTYKISREGNHSQYSVTDGVHTKSASLIWAFGLGVVGQSFLFQRGNDWYEARATFFGSLDNLHFTPARALSSARDLDEAMARPVSVAEVMRCFTCHSAGVTTLERVDTSRLSLGVTCEACHGPGGRHVEALRAEKLTQGAFSAEVGKDLIYNPARLAPADAVDFCGACHSTWWDVKLSGVSGPATTRSPSYRLENSRCWGKGDPRIACTACHDPHQPLARNIASYDEKCLACHVLSANSVPNHPGRACPVSRADCASCHMPKVEVPDLHYKFTDHDIRIVRNSELFPR